MQKRPIVMLSILLSLLLALPQGALSDWVEPVPASKMDDELWHVSYKFDDWLETGYPITTVASDQRDPVMEYFQGKLWVLWEGPLVLNIVNPPTTSYIGKLYMRSYSDWNKTVIWGDYIDVTPNAYYTDHANQKGQLITYKDRLYLFWMSRDRNQKPIMSPPDRLDIMMRTYDGNELNELTPPEILGRQGSFGDWGQDENPRPVIYKDKLYVLWSRKDLSTGTGDILYRDFDGTNWSDINVLSKFPNNDTNNSFPVPAVWEDRLYVLWQRAQNNTKYMETVCSYTTDGHSWSPPKPLSKPIPTSSMIFDTTPNLATYHNPITNKEELHAFWRAQGPEITQTGLNQFGIVSRTWDGANWSPTRELSPAGDSGDDTQPYGVDDQQGQLHIFWATSNDSNKDGTDHDIVQMTYDGNLYSAPTLVSRHNDTDRAFMYDNAWWNAGDDLNPVAKIYPNQWGDPRLFATWWTFDYITGCCYDQPDHPHPEIVLKLVLDADHDHDGVPDHLDACPTDPKDWKDSDGDGVCDNKDWKPFDPTIWEKPASTSDNGPQGNPLPVYLMVSVLIILGVALMAYPVDKKRPRPRKKVAPSVAKSKEE